jgi:hypothetical protein
MDGHSSEDKVSETKPLYSANYGKRPIHIRFKKASPAIRTARFIGLSP